MPGATYLLLLQSLWRTRRNNHKKSGYFLTGRSKFTDPWKKKYTERSDSISSEQKRLAANIITSDDFFQNMTYCYENKFNYNLAYFETGNVSDGKDDDTTDEEIESHILLLKSQDKKINRTN